MALDLRQRLLIRNRAMNHLAAHHRRAAKKKAKLETISMENRIVQYCKQ